MMTQMLRSYRTERIFVSSGLRYWIESAHAAQNQQWFGDWASKEGVGYNLGLESTFDATSEAAVGGLTEDLRKLAAPLDHSFVNTDVPELCGMVPSAENIASYWWQRVREHLQEGDRLTHVRVTQGPRSFVDYSGDLHRWTQVYKMNCLHRHHNPDLSVEENKDLYAKCSSVHGHEYTLEVSVQGSPDSQFGLVMPREEFSNIVQSVLLEPFDKTYLNEKIGNTSGEIIVQKFATILKEAFGSERFHSLKVHETRKNSFHYPAFTSVQESF